MGTLLQDLRYGLRMLVKTPGFTLTVVIILGPGIGLNSAIFSVVSGLLLREPPVKNPENVVMITLANPAEGRSRYPASALEFSAWRDQNHVFEGTAASSYDDLPLTGRGEPERVTTARVTPNYFEFLGVSARVGRTFTPGEDAANQQSDAVISYDLWQRKFGADPGVIGQGIALGGLAYTITGVMPAEFKYASGPCAVWIPASFDAQSLRPKERQNRNINVLARLKKGVSVREARAQTGAILQRLAQNDFDERNWIAEVMHLREALVDENTRTSILLLMVVVGFVLLIACANVAGIFLARSAARQNEFAIRVAFGAGRWRLIRQLLGESFLLALLGGGFGLLLSVWGVDLLRAKLSLNPDLARLAGKIDVNGRVLLFTLTISLVTVLLFGLMPALKSAKPDLQTALKGGGSTSAGVKGSRMRSALVISEIALAMVLMAATGASIQLLITEMRAQVGFDPKQVLTVDLSLSGSKYADPTKQSAFFAEAVERIQGLPGVQFVGATQVLPESAAPRVAFEVEGQPASKPEARPAARNYIVTPDYFRVMRIPMLQGRPFALSDRAGTPEVAIINETFSRRLFPKTDPIGRRIRTYASPTSTPDSREIVGIVGDVIDYVGQRGKAPQIYVPFLQKPSNAMKLVIRTSTNPALLGAAARDSIWALDRDQPIGSIEALTEIVEHKGGGDRLLGGLLGAFASLALGLAAIGIYGTVAYMVTQRTHEIGVRMALGAQKANVFRLVVGKGAFLATVGIGLGFTAALPTTRILARVYSGSWLQSSLILVLAPVMVMTAALLASYIPARRATKVDPMVALRYE